MYDKDIEFQIVTSLATGLLFGGLSKTILFTILFVVVFEFVVFHSSKFYPPVVKEEDRFIINLVFFLGWIIGRVLMLNETGFEDAVDFFDNNREIYCYPEDEFLYIINEKNVSFSNKNDSS